MNPVAQFEESVRTAWRSNLSAGEKAKRLKSIRAAILHYLVRIGGASEGDAWAIRSLDRARSYLKHLAADVEELALECERTRVAKKARSMVTRPYVA